MVLSAAAGLALAFAAAPPAVAGELFNDGESSIRWDNTLTYTGAFRLQGADPRLISDPNADDGDRDFRPGLVSNRVDLVSELGLTAGSFGAEVSGTAWYDAVYNQHTDNDSPGTFNPTSVPNTSFTKSVRTLQGRDAELLNAFIYDTFDVSGMPLTVRLGRHALLWGESLFFADNGVAAGQAPVDTTRAASLPYARASDVFMPVAQASASFQPSADLTFSAYYQFEWRKTRLPGVGSYFSVADFVDTGGERIIAGPDQYLVRGPDITPGSAQFGGALHVDTGPVDVGFYALRFNAKYPELYIRPGVYAGGYPGAGSEAAVETIEHTESYGVPSGTGAGGAYKINIPPGTYSGVGNVGSYDLVYPEGIQIFGTSASGGYVGDGAAAAEISARRNMPLVSKPRVAGAGVAADGGANALYAIGDTLQAQLSDITTFAPSHFWDGAELSAEFAANRLLDVTRNPNALDPTRNTFALAFRAEFEPQYFKVLPGLDLSLPLGFGYGLIGNSAVDGSQNAKAGDVEVGARLVYRAVWQATVTLTQYIGSPARQPFADRNYLSFSIRRTF